MKGYTLPETNITSPLKKKSPPGKFGEIRNMETNPPFFPGRLAVSFGWGVYRIQVGSARLRLEGPKDISMVRLGKTKNGGQTKKKTGWLYGGFLK